MTINTLEKELQKREVRPTAMRLLIFQYLLKNDVAVSLSDIEEHFDTSDRTTLYRTLKTFEEHGIVHQIDDGTGIAKYALCESDCNCEIEQDLHLHFHCTKCNETVCLTEHKIPHISLPEGYQAEDVNLVIKGICVKCNTRQNHG